MQIIVTGALGSGVTALAAAVGALGAPGDDGVLPEDGHDASWHGTDPRADAALSDVLDEVGLRWPFADASLALTTLDPPTAERVGERLVEARPTGIVADARWSHVLPLARGAWPEAIVVVATRRPGRVARWLEAHRAVPLPVGFAMWEVFTARALRGAGERVVVVDVDELRERPAATLRDLVARLAALGVDGLAVPASLPDLPLPDEVGETDTTALEQGYATAGWPELRAALAHPRPVRPSPLARDSLRSFALLLDTERRRRDEQRGRADGASPDGALRDVHDHARAHTLLEHERDSARRDVERLEEQLDALRTELATARTRLDDARRDARSHDERLRALSSHLADLVNDSRRREADLRRRLAGVVSKLKLIRPRVQDMRAAAGRYHEHEYEIYRLRTRVLKKEEAIQTLRAWLRSTNASVPLLPGALKDRLRFVRWNRAVTDERIKPLPKPLDELRDETSAKHERDDKRHREIERELDRARRELDATAKHSVVSETPLAKLGGVLSEAGVPLRVVLSKDGPRRRPRVAAHQVKPRSLVVYTAISGGYDALKRPAVLPRDCDFVCFTDDPDLRSDVWQMRPFDMFHVDPTRMARYVKTHPHVYFPDHEHSIWVDANLLLRGDVRAFVDALSDERPFAAFVHPHRDCVYAEADEIVARGGLDDERVVRRQVDGYRREGHPEHAGLVETNVLVRRHDDPRVVALMTAWWREIDNGSKRDQLSLPVVARRAGFDVAPLAPRGTSVRNHPALERYRHGAEGVKA